MPVTVPLVLEYHLSRNFFSLQISNQSLSRTGRSTSLTILLRYWAIYLSADKNRAFRLTLKDKGILRGRNTVDMMSYYRCSRAHSKFSSAVLYKSLRLSWGMIMLSRRARFAVVKPNWHTGRSFALIRNWQADLKILLRQIRLLSFTIVLNSQPPFLQVKTLIIRPYFFVLWLVVNA